MTDDNYQSTFELTKPYCTSIKPVGWRAKRLQSTQEFVQANGPIIDERLLGRGVYTLFSRMGISID